VLRRDEPPALVFAPLAWLKLKFFCHAGDTEVGGFAVSAEHDPLYVQDFVTVRQYTTAVSVEFDDAAVADHFDDAVDAGLTPARVARLWCHTHPGDSPEPSTTDEHTFARVFGACDWSVMFILSRTGRTYARLRFSAGPGGAVLLPVGVDWEEWPRAVLEQPEDLAGLATAWAAEFDRNVHPVSFLTQQLPAGAAFPRLADDIRDPWAGLDELHELQAVQGLVEEDEYGDFMRLVAAGEEMPGWRT
jgi:proteasome lid subunit RPN8/RPN11